MTQLTRSRPVGRIIDLADRHSSAVRNMTRRAALPTRWSQLFGHIALSSFVLVFVTGVALLLWFEPSMAQTTYNGAYEPMQGVRMSEAYASTLEISFDVTGGLLIRQIHHWASLVFIAALSAHLLRLFLTGSFRGPRRFGWLIVLALLVLSIVEAYVGHALPDDLLSGTGLRVTEGYLLAVPVVGTYLAWLVFGGEFPGDDVISRLNFVHAWVLPVLIVALFVAHLVITYRSRMGRAAADNVSATTGYVSRMGGFMLLVGGVIVVMAATIQVNPVWLWGPFDPAQAAAGSGPPWYLGFLDGAVRLMPPWDIYVFGHELTLSVLVPVMILPGVILAVLAAYPWFEQWIVRDQRDPDVVDRPRDMPVRTALGAAFVTFYVVLWIAGGIHVIVTALPISVNVVTRILQASIFVLPPVAFWITKRVCLGLQLRDQEELTEGRPSGVIVASPEGGFAESHEAVPTARAQHVAAHSRWAPIDPGPATDANGVPNPAYTGNRRRAALSRFYFADVARVHRRAPATHPSPELAGKTGGAPIRD